MMMMVVVIFKSLVDLKTAHCTTCVCHPSVVQVDEKTQAAWLGHPRHLIFDNSTGLDDKIERMTAAATRLLGSPCRPRRDCKFLLKQAPPPIDEFPVSVMEFEIEKVWIAGCRYAYKTSMHTSMKMKSMQGQGLGNEKE